MRSTPPEFVVLGLLLFLFTVMALAGCTSSGATANCATAARGTPPRSGDGAGDLGDERTRTAATDAVSVSGSMLVRSVLMVGSDDPVDVLVDGGVVTAIVPAGEGVVETRELLDGERRFMVPAFIDSHVHLLYRPESEAMGAGGIAAAVDLAAPMAFFETDFGDVRVVGTGPMVTARGGYPTRSWGSRGYGLECANADEAVAAVEALAEAGAVAIKLPITGAPVLDEGALRAAATRAHELGLRVASHALGNAHALLAAEIGADVLAHTPVEPLSDEAISAWAGRAVISTLRAFGGSEAAVDNLRRLRQAGTVVLYGTDFGNTRTPGIDRSELALLGEAGLDATAILTAATSAPAAFWGLDGLGSLEVGDDASFLLPNEDPFADPAAFASADVVLRGVAR